jgi:hypothetical protein
VKEELIFMISGFCPKINQNQPILDRITWIKMVLLMGMYSLTQQGTVVLLSPSSRENVLESRAQN